MSSSAQAPSLCVDGEAARKLLQLLPSDGLQPGSSFRLRAPDGSGTAWLTVHPLLPDDSPKHLRLTVVTSEKGEGGGGDSAAAGQSVAEEEAAGRSKLQNTSRFLCEVIRREVVALCPV